MRVLFNSLAALKPKTGVGHYIESLYEELCHNSDGDEIISYPRGLRERVIRESCRWFFSRKGKPGAHRSTPSLPSALRRLLSPSRGIARRIALHTLQKDFQTFARRHSFSLYHEPNFLPWPTHLRTVVTVHDLSVVLRPEWHPIDRVKAHEERFHRAVAESDHFIAVSKFTRQEMIQHLGLAPERITAVWNGIRSGFCRLPNDVMEARLCDLGLAPGYLLCVGTIEPRKNLLTVLRAYVALPPALRSKHPLILAGGWGWKSEEVQEYFERFAVPAGARHIGYVPEDSLPILYNGARALLYPSYYEGFGLPPVEMLACGGAVLASTAEAVVEVLSGHPSPCLEPTDVDAWRREIQTICTDDDYWRMLRRGAEAFAVRYSWRRSAQQTWEVYRKVLGVKTNSRQAA